MDISHRIRKLRKALNMNQEVFADSIGLTQSAISHIEQGGGVTVENLEKISTTHNANINWLMKGEGDMLVKVNNREKGANMQEEGKMPSIEVLYAIWKESELLKAKDAELRAKDIALMKKDEHLSKKDEHLSSFASALIEKDKSLQVMSERLIEMLGELSEARKAKKRAS